LYFCSGLGLRPLSGLFLEEHNKGKIMFEWNGFNYWAAEHYEFKVVQGTEEHCLALFRAEQINRPYRQYGTVIVDKEHDEATDEWQMVIRWYKTKEIYQKHLKFPPCYVRNDGKVL
jgi:hypothetical protein